MRNNQQYQQLIMQYNQLKIGADDILRMINVEDFDSAISMIKSREAIFLNCKCMLKFLELTEEEKKEVNIIIEELKKLEQRNIATLHERMNAIKNELDKTKKTEKILRAYDVTGNNTGSIVNIQE